jgi:hypothetical protein
LIFTGSGMTASNDGTETDLEMSSALHAAYKTTGRVA